MKDLEKNIISLIKKNSMVALATVTKEGLPWVRYVGMNVGKEMVFRTATFKKSRKVAHIKKNPEVHVTCGYTGKDGKPYLQIQAKAVVSTSQKEKDALWNDHFKAYFKGPKDPNYVVIIMEPYRIEYVDWKTPKPLIWKKK